MSGLLKRVGVSQFQEKHANKSIESMLELSNPTESPWTKRDGGWSAKTNRSAAASHRQHNCRDTACGNIFLFVSGQKRVRFFHILD
jgi:hypothetical protein